MKRALKTERAQETPPDQANMDSGLNILFLAAFPLISWLFQGSFAGAATALIMLWVFSLALRLISKGEQKHKAYEAAEVAIAPRVPRKLIGAILIGAMVMILAGHKIDSLFLPMVIGALAAALSIVAFGVDPMRNKGKRDPQREMLQQAEMALERADHALAQVADQVAMLEDAEITRRTEAARVLILRMMRSFMRDPQSVLRIAVPVAKFTDMLRAEAKRLISSQASESATFVRKRYLAKLDVMTESFEKSARKTRARGDKDAFELEADLLLDRMPRETAA